MKDYTDILKGFQEAPKSKQDLHARWVEMCKKAGAKPSDFSLKNVEL